MQCYELQGDGRAVTYYPPAVTQHIQFLEKEYGCRLLLYENRKLIKTPAAQMLEDYLRSVQQRENFLREKIKKQWSPGTAHRCNQDHWWLCNHRTEFTNFLNQPDTALTLIVDNTKHLLHLLEQNTLDYAIIEGFFDKNRFGSQLYRREPFVGICPKDHPFAGREVSVEEILKETLIHRETALELWLSWRKSFWSIMNLWSVFTGIYVFPALRWSSTWSSPGMEFHLYMKYLPKVTRSLESLHWRVSP